MRFEVAVSMAINPTLFFNRFDLTFSDEMTIFRPCIDLHSGQVKQIVGGTLNDATPDDLKTNYVSTNSAGFYAALYKRHSLRGSHVIMLGSGNEAAAREAVETWPGQLQIGGGITDKNAAQWITWGAGQVIVTSYLFPEGTFSMPRLQSVLQALGNDKSKLVIDLSCRRKGSSWFVATNKWQTITDYEITPDNLKTLEQHCGEFLIHAADNEGLQRGIDEALIQRLASCCSIPVTYAGGAKHIDDLARVRDLSNGRIDVTIGSALDIFGGSLVKFEDCIQWNKANGSG